MDFEWDIRKEALNMRKHGVSFEEAKKIFFDPFHLSIPDVSHSENEDRWITIGQAFNKELIIVVIHTYRENDDEEMKIRLISARKATSKEKRQYQERRNKI